MRKVFIICSVRGASDEYRAKLEKYVANLEQDSEVHLPHRDTNQNETGINICKQNAEAIKCADEVHIFYSSKSQGTHFDMGVAFALNKKLVIAENEEYGEGKSYPRMITEWQEATKTKCRHDWEYISGNCFGVDYSYTACKYCGEKQS